MHAKFEVRIFSYFGAIFLHAPTESPDMTPEKFFRKGAWPGSRDSLNVWALNANSSKMTKDTNF